MSVPHARAPSAYRIEQAMSVALATRDRLLRDDPDLAADEAALRDTLDGETDAYDIMRRLARFALEAEAMEATAKQRAADITARQKRFAARADTARSALFAMMDALGEKTLIDAEFTATVRPGRPSVQITDEAAIPESFVRVTRAPDKVAIAMALKAGEQVPGAEATNGVPTIQIRGA